MNSDVARATYLLKNRLTSNWQEGLEENLSAK